MATLQPAMQAALGTILAPWLCVFATWASAGEHATGAPPSPPASATAPATRPATRPAIRQSIRQATPPAASAQRPGDIAAGQRVFARCASCHQIGGSAGAAFGPQLTGIVGRRAAATGDFNYSPAMKASRLVWTEDRLAAFVRDPKKVVPGTSMRFWGLSDERQIADLIAFLRSVK